MVLQSVRFGSLGKLQGAEVPMAVAGGAFPVGAALTWRSCWHTLFLVPWSPGTVLLVTGSPWVCYEGRGAASKAAQSFTGRACEGKCYPRGSITQGWGCSRIRHTGVQTAREEVAILSTSWLHPGLCSVPACDFC